MRPVIVFDSGVGGLSILAEIRSQSPNLPLIYLADQAYFPYGTRSDQEIRSRLSKFAHWANQYHPAALVIACNTATVSGVSLVRKEVSCPVVGVEPVVKPLSKYRRPLLIATKTTLSSSRHQELVLAHTKELLSLCPHNLIPSIESMDREGIERALGELGQVIDNEQVDAIGLSCTHYPLIIPQLHEHFPNLTIIDPSSAVVHHLLSTIAVTGRVPSLSLFTTANPQNLSKQVQYYLDLSQEAKKVVL